MLRACLESLRDGVADVGTRVIAIDNASEDGSVEMVRREFPDVVLIANEANMGFAHANNQAYALAEGPYFLLLNPDTVVRPGAIARMVAFMRCHDDAGGVTGRLTNPDGTLQRYYKRLPSWRYVFASHTLYRRCLPAKRLSREFYMADQPFDRVVKVEQPPAACLLIRRDRVPGAVLFDERFPIFFNDIDLCRSLARGGSPCYFLPDAEVMHHGSRAGVDRLGDDAIIDYLIGLVRYTGKHAGRARAGMLWGLLALESSIALTVGLGQTMIGRGRWGAFGRECRRRGRLAAMRESFRYPPGYTPSTT